MRMEEQKWRNRALNYTPHNTRKKGRSALTWIDGIKRTMELGAIGKYHCMTRDMPLFCMWGHTTY